MHAVSVTPIEIPLNMAPLPASSLKKSSMKNSASYRRVSNLISYWAMAYPHIPDRCSASGAAMRAAPVPPPDVDCWHVPDVQRALLEIPGETGVRCAPFEV